MLNIKEVTRLPNVLEPSTMYTIVVDEFRTNVYVTDNQGSIVLKGEKYPDFNNGDIINILKNKVDKEPGKGLSSNDFTDELYEKLKNLQAGATINSPDSYLLDRNNHTGTQSIDTIRGLRESLESRNGIISGRIASTPEERLSITGTTPAPGAGPEMKTLYDLKEKTIMVHMNGSWRTDTTRKFSDIPKPVFFNDPVTGALFFLHVSDLVTRITTRRI